MKVTVKASARLNLDITAKATRAAEAATRVVGPELNSAFQAAIGAKVWSWPRVTYRGSTYRKDGSRTKGYQVGSPRNIVDRGILKASNSLTISGNLVTFRWAVGYATAVHDGARIYPFGDRTKKQVLLPARPWTSAVLGKLIIPGIEPFDYGSAYKASFISAYRNL